MPGTTGTDRPEAATAHPHITDPEAESDTHRRVPHVTESGYGTWPNRLP
ncbi:hypothetical protein ACGFY7_14380 [Streptomyces prunicolor]